MDLVEVNGFHLEPAQIVRGADRIEKGFALFHTGRFRLQVHGIGAEASRGSGKTDARASGIFEKSQGDRLAPEGR